MENQQLTTINVHNLEQELVDQPGAVHYCLIQCAEKLQARKKAEIAFSIATAKMDDEVRSRLEEEGKKPTETAIKKIIMGTPEFFVVQSEVDDAAHALHLVEAEREALNHKKSALENLVKLRLSDWYSEPNKQTNHEEDTRRQQRGLPKPKRMTEEE